MNSKTRGSLTIDHLAVAVSDLDEAVSWYSALGFRELERRVTKGRQTAMRSAVMASGASIIVLVQGLSRDCQVQKFVDNFGPGVQHLGIAVDDLDAALDKLRACGGAPEFDIIVGDGIRQVFLRRDPGSGVRIELIERKGGTFTDDTIERLYRSFEDAGAY